MMRLTDTQRKLVESHLWVANRAASTMLSRSWCRHDSDTVLSEAYFGLCAAGRKFDGRGSFQAYASLFVKRWLLTELVQKAARRLRTRRTVLTVPAFDRETSGYDAFAAVDFRDLFGFLSSKLGTKQKAVAGSIYMDGFRQQDAAAALGMSTQAVQGLHERAVRNMKDRYLTGVGA